MTESDARAVLLVRAFETAPNAAWSDADSAQAGEAARRIGGEHAPFETWLVARARAAVDRIAQRDAAATQVLRATDARPWLAWIAVAVAFVAGAAADAIGPAHRINILAPPLLALLAWNLAVYAVLAAHRLIGAQPLSIAPLRNAVLAWLERGERRVSAAAGGAGAAPLGAFIRAWAGEARALHEARIAFVLHACAAALVVGAIVGLYTRGLVLEYRAGWDSTFITPAAVHAIVAAVLGPAAWLSGIDLPDAGHLATLRFSAGPGENAAAWIHLYAITAALVVVVPRTALALAAALRAKRWARQWRASQDDPYFQRLRRDWSGAAVAVRVLPYSYALGDPQRRALTAALEGTLASRVELALAETLPLGAEDDLVHWIGDAADSPSTLVPLFALTATPEREHHGAFVRALRERVGAERVAVLVDESGFRDRFPGADLAARLDQRRALWRSALTEEGVQPSFVDLRSEDERSPDGAGAPASAAR